MNVTVKVPKFLIKFKFYICINDVKRNEGIDTGTDDTVIAMKAGDKIKFQQANALSTGEITIEKDTEHITLRRSKIYIGAITVLVPIFILIIFFFFFPMHNGVNMFDRMFPVLILAGILAGYSGSSLDKMYVIEQE